MKVMMIGNGGREYAFVLKLLESDQLERIDFIPGNGGTSRLGKRVRNVNIDPTDSAALIQHAQENNIDLTIVGPEAPLVAGIVDDFRNANLLICGPDKSAARLEGSKSFTKEILENYEVPTAGFMVFDEFPDAVAFVEEHFKQRRGKKIVVKADGLASGKGVEICDTLEEAKAALQKLMVDGAFKGAGETVVIEEFLKGHELSFMGLYDGTTLTTMIASQDHKQRFEGDIGPMTGGMGAFAPVPWVTESMINDFAQAHILPLLENIQHDYGIYYTGFLYIALMYTDEGFKVLEWNVRPGDPETEAVLGLMMTDLLSCIQMCVNAQLDRFGKIDWYRNKHTVCIALCEDPYPDSPTGGFEITGIEKAEEIKGVTVIHAGTKLTDDGRLVTAGGRVLYVRCIADSLKAARTGANKAAELIQFQNKVYRTDIGNRKQPVLH